MIILSIYNMQLARAVRFWKCLEMERVLEFTIENMHEPKV